MLITITNAGVAALVNAQNTGTLPVLIAQVGVTSTAFAPSASLSALPGEIKRLSTFSGQTVADDTIHVTIRDESADVYTMRGFGLYLNDGTLFALYGQSNALLEKSAQALLLLAADIRFTQIAAASMTFGNSSWVNPPATTETPGVVELAANAEANAGTDTQRAVTPAALAYVFEQRGAYYLDWNNFTNVPSVFPPDAHAHAWGDISGVPTTFPPSTHGHDVAQVSGAAPLASPVFTGTPTAPTAAAGTNNGQLATTQFVVSQIAASASSLFARKTADTERANTITFEDDPHLFVDIPTPGRYLIQAGLYAFWGSPAGLVGVQFGFSYSGTTSSSFGVVTGFAANALREFRPSYISSIAGAAEINDVYGGSSGNTIAQPTLLLDGHMSFDTAGRFRIRWRPNAVTTAAVKVQKESFIRVTRIA